MKDPQAQPWGIDLPQRYRRIVSDEREMEMRAEGDLFLDTQGDAGDTACPRLFLERVAVKPEERG
jgi:hypothetical protein